MDTESENKKVCEECEGDFFPSNLETDEYWEGFKVASYWAAFADAFLSRGMTSEDVAQIILVRMNLDQELKLTEMQHKLASELSEKDRIAEEEQSL